MSHKTMAEQIALESNFEQIPTDDEMYANKQQFFRLYTGVAKYIKTMKTIVHNCGEVKTVIGRKRYLPE